ncbi:sulfotransferase [Thalassotalea euphylliae]|uniref:tetratricopeptide repeat-containing sulfotransferase family protein n=1 Tax=Thalassotalea euphylliae TaxID=1655234 RepID=UPI00363D17E6
MSNTYQDALNSFKAENYKKASKQLLKLRKRTLDENVLLQSCAFKLEQFNKVIELGKQLIPQIADKKAKANMLYHMGVASFKLNRVNDGERFFVESLQNDEGIDNAKSRYELCVAYYQLEKYEKLELMSEKLLAWEKYFAKAQLLRIEKSAKVDSKKILLDRVTKILPYANKLHSTEFADLGTYLLGLGMLDEFESALSSYELANKEQRWFERAKVLFEKGKYAETLDAIEFAQNHPEKKVQPFSAMFYLKGKVLDKLSRYDEAFDNFQAGAEIVSKRKEASNKSVYADKLLKLYPKMEFKTPTLRALDKKIVFVAGFPRSGTTLLDNILDTQDALVLSERNIFYKLIKYIESTGLKYPQDLTRISIEQIVEYQEKFFEFIDEQGYRSEEHHTIIEKGPHLTEHIPLIKQIFPDSKIIVCLRHPLDVAISCFQQEFVLNNYNSHLVRFDDIVRRYNKVFSLLEMYTEQKHHDVFCFRYEDLIENFSKEMESIFSYLQIDFDDTYKAFDKKSKDKFITSASRGQVDKKLNKDSMYKWKNYEKKIAPYKSELAYFCEKFDYKQ